jgi:uncharacterized membrane protein YiaA
MVRTRFSKFAIILFLTGVASFLVGTFLALGIAPEIGYSMMVIGFIVLAGMCLAVANPDETSVGEEIGEFT